LKKFLTSLVSQDRIAGGAFVLAITALLSSVCGFLRDQAFSIMFPLDKDPIGVASVYIAAFRPSDLLFQLFVMSCLSVIVVPFLGAHIAHNRRDQVNQLTSSTMVVFGTAFGIVALFMCVAFPWIAPHLVKFQGATLDIYIRYGQIAFFTNFLFVFGNTIGQYLIAVQRYWIYGISPIVWALCTISGIYFLSPIIGPLGPITGTVIGTIAYVVLRFWAAIRCGFVPKLPDTSWIHSEISSMGWLIIPRMAALGALQLQLLLLDRLASGLGKYGVALNQFASNFESVIPGIVGIAIGTSAFSLLSQYAARRDRARFLHTMRKGLLMNIALSIPGSIALAACAGVGAWLMRLSPTSAPVFIISLRIYAIAVTFESVNHVILRSFYSMKNTGWPALTSAASSGSAVLAGTLLLPQYGIYALAWAYVIGQVSQTILLSSAFFYLQRGKGKFSVLAFSAPQSSA
jgi:peptidoglycan biosynthesis protein MviN/MurJ (putative lipid II flippase)